MNAGPSAFDLSFVEHGKDVAEDFHNINAAIDRLTNLRKAEIQVEGPFFRSKLAWKIATYQEAVLYRAVALMTGARLAWNAKNQLACFILVRALVETFAVFDEFVREVLASLEREDLGAMDELVMNRTFATKDNEMLRDHPNLVATNVLTFIDKMGKHYDLPVRTNYDNLSERCHPNSAGHHQMYSATEKPSGRVTFSETKNLPMALTYIRAPLGLVFLFERSMERLTEATIQIAELQHRLHPR
jgi:hypothetical protein